MRNRYLLGAGIALAIAFGGAEAHAQLFGPYPPGAFYLGPEGGWTKLFSQTPRHSRPGSRRGLSSLHQSNHGQLQQRLQRRCPARLRLGSVALRRRI